jgi:hypothetical protein
MSMKLFLLLLANFIVIDKIYCQQNYGVVTVEFNVKSRKNVTIKADVTGSFRGGDSALKNSIAKNINTAGFRKTRVKRGTYTAKVQYVIDKTGNIADVKCLNDPGYGMCKEVVRVVIKSSPWRPSPSPVLVR